MLTLLKNKSQAKTSSILERCRKDEATRMRKKYAPYYHPFERQEGAHVWLNGKKMILLSSNDYLGLSNHPKVMEASQRAIREWGTSPTGARLANGSRSYHLRLEEKLAAFLGKEACHVSAAGYLSCMSSVQAFGQKGDLIVVDKNVHSALWSGIGLTQAEVERFGHNNPEDLREVLSYEKPERPKLLVCEGVYSMEGHIGKLNEILEVSEDHDCFYILDDAHGFGVLGDQGRGTANHLGLSDSWDIITGSLSKSFSSTGGFVAGSHDIIDYYRTNSKQMIFSAALSPSQAAAAEASLEVMQEEPEHLQRLWSNTERYKQILHDIKLDTWQSETPAVPIVLGSKERAYRFWKLLMEEGVFTIMSIAPAVPPKKDLVRTAISARHSDEDLERIGEAMQRAAKRL